MDLVILAAAALGLGLFLYVLLDGFDLGLGALTLLMRDPHDREHAIATMAPVWDGNETWLVFGGIVLFAAFPLAYAALMPALYVPVMVMLFALVFRGVVFEYRAKATRTRRLWELGFGLGSLLAGFAQGVMLGSFLAGFRIEQGAFAGGAFDWLSPFALMSGAGLVCGYALLGAGWLAMKTTGSARDWGFAAMRRLVPLLALFIVVVSLWTPWQHPAVAARWFAWPNLLLLSPVPLLTAALLALLWRAVGRRQEVLPFWLTIGLFGLCYAGLAISLYPYVVPPDITLWQAAAAPGSLVFLLVGIGVLLPVILAYTAYAYWVFRGKVDPGSAYH
jgi:cytochrome bd ubiquinol oxidase subunit II